MPCDIWEVDRSAVVSGNTGCKKRWGSETGRCDHNFFKTRSVSWPTFSLALISDTANVIPN